MAEDIISIAGAGLSAEISTIGAELRTLRDADGRDLLWNGDPAWWTGRAPILFPVIGVVNGGVVHVDGVAYPMPKHGFVRHHPLQVVARDDAHVRFRLEADDTTRAAYPFDFRLDIAFAIEGAALTVRATVHNSGTAPLPASFGFHPALLWPLPYGGARDAHRIVFDRPEPAPIRRIDADGLLTPEPHPTPIDGDTLAPTDAMFVDDALILDAPASRRLLWGVPGHTRLAIEFPDMPMLGIWTKPGAGYLCIEPWHSHADELGFAGEFANKPGIVTLDPGETKTFTMSVTFGVPLI